MATDTDPSQTAAGGDPDTSRSDLEPPHPNTPTAEQLPFDHPAAPWNRPVGGLIVPRRKALVQTQPLDLADEVMHIGDEIRALADRLWQGKRTLADAEQEYQEAFERELRATREKNETFPNVEMRRAVIHERIRREHTAVLLAKKDVEADSALKSALETELTARQSALRTTMLPDSGNR